MHLWNLKFSWQYWKLAKKSSPYIAKDERKIPSLCLVPLRGEMRLCEMNILGDSHEQRATPEEVKGVICQPWYSKLNHHVASMMEERREEIPLSTVNGGRFVYQTRVDFLRSNWRSAEITVETGSTDNARKSWGLSWSMPFILSFQLCSLFSSTTHRRHIYPWHPYHLDKFFLSCYWAESLM